MGKRRVRVKSNYRFYGHYVLLDKELPVYGMKCFGKESTVGTSPSVSIDLEVRTRGEMI